MDFLSIFRTSSPPQKRKAPYWKLSGDGSRLNTMPSP